MQAGQAVSQVQGRFVCVYHLQFSLSSGGLQMLLCKNLGTFFFGGVAS